MSERPLYLTEGQKTAPDSSARSDNDRVGFAPAEINMPFHGTPTDAQRENEKVHRTVRPFAFKIVPAFGTESRISVESHGAYFHTTTTDGLGLEKEPSMSSVEDHYRSFLAEWYSWMSGGHDTQIERSRKMLESIGVGGFDGRNAVDLGCGSGYQSLALAEMGFHVTAVDTSEALLEELRSRVEGQQIATVLGDMTDASVYASAAPFQVAVCMGDSLVHLEKVEHVRQMFGDLHGVLEEGGKLVLSFRDLSQELTGIDRAIPVRLDDSSLMATFLEYTDRL